MNTATNTNTNTTPATGRHPRALVVTALVTRQRAGHEAQLRALGLTVESRDYPRHGGVPNMGKYDVVLVVPDHCPHHGAPNIIQDAARAAGVPFFFAPKKTSDAAWDLIEAWCNEHADPPDHAATPATGVEVVASAPLARSVQAEAKADRATADAAEWAALAEEYEKEAARHRADVQRLQSLLLRTEHDREEARATTARANKARDEAQADAKAARDNAVEQEARARRATNRVQELEAHVAGMEKTVAEQAKALTAARRSVVPPPTAASTNAQAEVAEQARALRVMVRAGRMSAAEALDLLAREVAS